MAKTALEMTAQEWQAYHPGATNEQLAHQPGLATTKPRREAWRVARRAATLLRQQFGDRWRDVASTQGDGADRIDEVFDGVRQGQASRDVNEVTRGAVPLIYLDTKRDRLPAGRWQPIAGRPLGDLVAPYLQDEVADHRDVLGLDLRVGHVLAQLGQFAPERHRLQPAAILRLTRDHAPVGHHLE